MPSGSKTIKFISLIILGSLLLVQIASARDVDAETYPYLHGNEIKEDNDGKFEKNEFKVYNTELEVNEILKLYLRVDEGSLILATYIGEKVANDNDAVKPLRDSLIQMIADNQTSNSDYRSVTLVEDGNTSIDLPFSETTELQVLVISYNETMNAENDVYFYLYSSHPLSGDAKGSWYNKWFINSFRNNAITHPPLSLVFLLLVSIGISLLSGGVTRLLVDMEEINKTMKKVQDHNKLKRKAQGTADKKLWAKVQSKDSTITTLQQKMMFKRMLPQFILMVPFITIFSTLRGAMGLKDFNLTPDRGSIVAILPFRVLSGVPLIGGWFSRASYDPALSVAGFGTMYFLSAIVASTIIQRIFGLNLQGTRPENPFQNN